MSSGIGSKGSRRSSGAYYVTRQFDWLFRAVVLNNEPVRESVLDYTREINRELTSKREELGYETDRRAGPRWKELYWKHYTHIYASTSSRAAAEYLAIWSFRHQAALRPRADTEREQLP